MSASVAPYTALITSEHADKPNFVATVALSLQPSVDQQEVAGSLLTLFDVDNSVGQQLDFIGVWVGITRNVSVPLTNVYFSLDSATLGLDQGYLQGRFDPSSGLVSLNDATYRVVLKARIAANYWDGTIPGAYAVWDTLFSGESSLNILVQDNEDMTMILALTGTSTDITPVIQQLFAGGYINLVPAGVGVTYLVPSFSPPMVSSLPYFGLDCENASISGLDVGAFGTVV